MLDDNDLYIIELWITHYSKIMHYELCIDSNAAEECHQEGDTEIYSETMVDWKDHKLFARDIADYRQCCVHTGGTSGRDGGERTWEFEKQRGAQKGDYLARDICQQGDGA